MFTIQQHPTSKGFQFVLHSKKGILLLSSIVFTTPKEAMKGIELCKTQVQRKTNIERKTTTSGKFHFSIKDIEGKLLADSMLYSSEPGMQNGKEAIRNYAPMATVIKTKA